MNRLSRFNIVVRLSDIKIGIFNSLSGSSCTIASDSRAESVMLEQKIRMRDIGAIDAGIIALLTKAKMTTSAEDESALIENLFTGVRESGLFHLTFVITRDCNLRCPYCYQTRASQTMTESIIDTVPELITARVKNAKPLSALEVAWYGGEPLLYPELFATAGRRIRDFCDRAGVSLVSYLITNGTRLDKELIMDLQPLLNLKSVQVTFDGNRVTHDRSRRFADGGGSFDVIVSNLEKLNTILPMIFRVNITAGRHNGYSDLLSVLKKRRLIGRGSKNIVHFAPVRKYTMSCSACSSLYSTPDSFIKRNQELLQFCLEHDITNVKIKSQFSWCSAINRNSFVVGPQGELYKCWEQVGMESAAIGSSQQGAICEEKEGHWLRFSPFDYPRCRACRYLPICMGGCPYIRLGYSDVRDDESYCKLMKQVVNDWIRYNCECKRRKEVAGK